MGWENTRSLYYVQFHGNAHIANIIEYESYEVDGLIHARTKFSHFDTLALSIKKLNKPSIHESYESEYEDPDLNKTAEYWSYDKQKCIDFIEEQKQIRIKLLEQKIIDLQNDIEYTKSCVVKDSDI